jgi:hypothetical protein
MYINISTGSKVTSITGMLACMIWNGTPYYAHTDYDSIKKIQLMIFQKKKLMQ